MLKIKKNRIHCPTLCSSLCGSQLRLNRKNNIITQRKKRRPREVETQRQRRKEGVRDKHMLHTRSSSVADSFTRGGREGEGEGGEREFLSSVSFVATRNVRLTTQWKQQLHDRWWLLDRPTDRPALPILTFFLRPWVQLSSFTPAGQVVIGQPTVRGSVTRKHTGI